VAASTTARRSVRSGVLRGYVFGVVVASQSLAYASTYKTARSRTALAAIFGHNAGLAAINGQAYDLTTTAGFTAWKCLMFLALAGSVWGLLLATRLVRGEEEAGRFELLAVGPTTRRRATAETLAGLGAGPFVLWAITAAVTIAVGHSSKVRIGPGAALYFALALALPALVFAGVGAVTSELAPTRRQASSWAGLVLGASYAVRMVADSSNGTVWLRWLSPLGWAEELHPLYAPDPLALVPLVALAGLLAGAAVVLSGRRDIGTGVLAGREGRAGSGRLLGSAGALALRLQRSTLAVWAGGIGLGALLLGSIATDGGKLVATSSTLRNDLSRIGATGPGATQYLSITFVLVALLVAFLAAGEAAGLRAEEASGRLEPLVVAPVSRSRWLAGRVAIAAGSVLACGVLAGALTFLGSVASHARLGAGPLLEAGLNIVPPALCVFGAGVLALGLVPRAVAPAAYGLVAWSFLAELLGAALHSNRLLLDLSLFHQMAPAPAAAPDWTSAGVMVGLALAAVLVGGAAFRRRDLAGA